MQNVTVLAYNIILLLKLPAGIVYVLKSLCRLHCSVCVITVDLTYGLTDNGVQSI